MSILSLIHHWWTMKNLFAALAFVTVCLLMGNAIVVFAQDGEHLTKAISENLTGSLMQVFSTEDEDASMTGSLIVGEPDPDAPTNAKAIRVFLRQQRAYLLEYGKVVKTYRISTGAWETPTPRGNFQIHKKQPLRISSQGVPYRMPNYMAFTPNEAFGLHALPYLGRSKESSWYWQEANNHIGTPVSHGCIRFLPEEAVEVYEWADVGTKVFIRS